MFGFFRRNDGEDRQDRGVFGRPRRDRNGRNEGGLPIPGLDAFAEVLNFATREVNDTNGAGNGGPFAAPAQQTPAKDPPASAQAVRTLPIVKVMPENLIDEINRECCICFEPNCLGDKVLRLPCAHIFHPTCILDWVNRHCTCPICRYELPTDDPQYEIGRKERMRKRKPRYARYELERMSVQRLKELMGKDSSRSFFEKGEMVDFLIKSEKIDLVKQPPPVEYKLSELRSMRVGQLKQTMEKAGVFYFSHDIVEKEDLIKVFQLSGRLAELPEPEEEFKVDAQRATETSYNSREYSMETNEDVDEAMTPNQMKDGQSIVVETVEDELDAGDRRPTDSSLPPYCLMEEIPDFDSNETNNSDNLDRLGGQSQGLEQEIEVTADEARSPNDLNENDRSELPGSVVEPVFVAKRSRTGSYSDTSPGSSISQSIRDNFRNCSVSDLLAVGRKANVDLSSCCERSEMIELLVKSGITTPHNIPLVRSNFTGWGVSQLRALATVIDLDLPEYADRDAMIGCFLTEANGERLHLRNYLRALTPLARLSLPELRAFAREQNVDISGCLEKEEVIHRLMVAPIRDYADS